MTNRPYVHKHGNTWRVTIGTHLYAARATHADALAHGNRIAGYARRIRFKRDIQRMHASLERMENR